MDFPNGIDGILTGDRGREFDKTWNVKIFRVHLNRDGKQFNIVEAEIGYKGHFWKVGIFGNVTRVGNGTRGGHRLLKLCENATISPAMGKRAFNKMVREWLYDSSN